MADIKKELKLVASLEDQKLKSQIQQLRRELSQGLSFKAMDLSSLEKSFEKVADRFTQKITKAVNDLRAQENRSQSTRRRSAANEIFDPQRGKYVKVQEGQIYDKESGKKFKTEQDLARYKEAQALKLERKLEQVRKRQEDQKHQRELRRMRELERSFTFRAARTMGAGTRTAAGISEAVGMIGGRFGGGMGRLAGMAGGAMGATGAAVMGGVAVAAFAANRLSAAQDRARQFRQSRATEAQEVGLALAQGRGTEGVLRRRARRGVGTFERAERGVAGFLSAFNPFSEDFLSNPMEAGRQAIRQREESEQEAQLAETQMARGALGRARGLRRGRVAAMRGGGITGNQLTAAQGMGANLGFGLEETLQQTVQARQFLGNRALMREAAGGGMGPRMTNLATMQDIMQRTGVDVGEQARAAEIFAGGGRTTMGEGVQRQIETLKKGVAAGLDVSKSGQFLRTTADFIQSTAGLGQLDTDQIAEQMSRAVFGFARGGEATQMDVQRAAQLQQQIRQESLATGGAAGIGNILGIQQALPNATPGQLLAGQNLSSNASVQDIQTALEVDEATARQIQQSKQGNLQRGLGAMGVEGGSPLGLFLGGKETGQTTEQFLGRMQAENFQGPMPAGGLGAGAVGTEELRSLTAEFRTNQTEFVQGFAALANETTLVNNEMSAFRSQLSDAVSKLRELTSEVDKLQGKD